MFEVIYNCNLDDKVYCHNTIVNRKTYNINRKDKMKV